METALHDIPLGRAARKLWTLREDGVFLNQGAYGAVPRCVQQEQTRLRDELERHPDAFMARVKPVDANSVVREAARQLAAFAGTTAQHIAMVENTTTGVQAVLNSLPFMPGDQILITEHQYNAVRLAVEQRCLQTGALPLVVRIPLPTRAEDIAQRVLDAAGPQVKLVLLDHITSGTALVFPIERIAPELRRRGIPLFVDGAHAIGQIPLDIPALGADWYVTNMHKWLFAPRGSALLYASASATPLTRPTITSHYIGMGFPNSFDYVGTRDYTAWLATPAALGFFQALGPERVRAHNSELVRLGSDAMLAAGAQPIAPLDMCAAMRAFILPQIRPATEADGTAVTHALWEKERIQIRCVSQAGLLLLRFSAQAYVSADDVKLLGATLLRHGWPGRH